MRLSACVSGPTASPLPVRASWAFVYVLEAHDWPQTGRLLCEGVSGAHSQSQRARAALPAQDPADCGGDRLSAVSRTIQVGAPSSCSTSGGPAGALIMLISVRTDGAGVFGAHGCYSWCWRVLCRGGESLRALASCSSGLDGLLLRTPIGTAASADEFFGVVVEFWWDLMSPVTRMSNSPRFAAAGGPGGRLAGSGPSRVGGSWTWFADRVFDGIASRGRPP